MAATLVNNNDQINNSSHEPVLLDVQLFSAPGLEDETDVDGTTIIDNSGKDTPSKPSETTTPVRLWSNVSLTASSLNRKQRSKSRSYKFIQLERALTSANILKHNDDRVKFESEYLLSIRNKTFDEFLQKYYEKIREHYEQIKQEQEIKKARIFTVFNVEQNFLALDPTRDVKIIFVDEPSESTRAKTVNIRSTVTAHQRATSAAATTDAAVEAFYAKRSHLLLSNPSRARDEVTLFARRTAERLHERLPRLTSVPHRVKIVDERDTSGKPDERALLQLKHKHAVSLINRRRQVIFKMMTQTKKNQVKMEHEWNQPSFAIDSSACCRELLERANQIEQVCVEKQRKQRPQTAMHSRRTTSKNMSYSTSASVITMTNTDVSTAFTSSSTPFQDAISLDHMEKTKNIRVLLPTRPLTAPTKVNWKNYC